jgi:hypothetical protein
MTKEASRLVLVVEDERLGPPAAGDVSRNARLSVVTAETADEGLEQLRARRPVAAVAISA